MKTRVLLLWGLVILAVGCIHPPHDSPHQWAGTHAVGPEPDGCARTKCGNSVNAHIRALLVRGEFTQAEAYIVEAKAAGLLSKPQATQWLEKIAKLNTKLGEIPASVQRAKGSPSQLRDYTLHQIEQMLKDDDFSIATAAQLRQAAKLIKEYPRILPKAK